MLLRVSVASWLLFSAASAELIRYDFHAEVIASGADFGKMIDGFFVIPDDFDGWRFHGMYQTCTDCNECPACTPNSTPSAIVSLQAGSWIVDGDVFDLATTTINIWTTSSGAGSGVWFDFKRDDQIVARWVGQMAAFGPTIDTPWLYSTELSVSDFDSRKMASANGLSASTKSLTYIGTFADADFNMDGSVDTLDYAAWQSTDPVDAAAYTLWRDNYQALAVSQSPVPEPSAGLVASLCFAAYCVLRSMGPGFPRC